MVVPLTTPSPRLPPRLTAQDVAVAIEIGMVAAVLLFVQDVNKAVSGGALTLTLLVLTLSPL